MPSAVSEIIRMGPDPDCAEHSIHSLAGSEISIIIYGAGSGYITFSEFVLRKYGYKPSLILDKKFSHETSFDGCRADSPDNISSIEFQNESAVFIVTLGERSTYSKIRDVLKSGGAKNVCWALDIYEYHLSHAPKDFHADVFLEQEGEIEACFNFLEDELSRRVFLRLLEINVRRVPLPVPAAPIDDQYFPNDVVLSKGHSRLISCGSYTGDTVRQLNRRLGKINALACFEPDTDNYISLSKYLCENIGRLADTVVSFPCGVYSDERVLKFSSGNNTNSSLSERGHYYLQCVSIDHTLPDFSPTMINMDIEGAEPEALRGAINTIDRWLPDLAISVYHKPEHIYEIPRFIRSINGKYKIYLRNYTSFPAETVMYATL